MSVSDKEAATPAEQSVEEDTNAAPEGENHTPEEQHESTDSASNEGEEGAADSSAESGDELPEWAREKLTKANAEAANYRTKLREAEKKLEEAKTPEQVEEILAQMKAEREEQERKDAEEKRALLVENIAMKYKLPAKLANRLVGSTREELEADAKELAADFAEDEEDISLEGGLSPRGAVDGDPSDPGELARMYGGRKRR